MSKVTGFDEFQKQLEDLSVNAKNLDGKNVSIYELLNNEFMAENTSFSSLDDLFENGLHISSISDLEEYPEDKLDEIISAKTDFDNWEELIEEATAEYVYKQLELL